VKIKLIAVALVCMLFLSSCTGAKNVLVNTAGHLTKIDYTASIDSNEAERLNTFAVELYKQLYKDNENVFISPASIYLALGMIYNGANGKTADEMATVLDATGSTLDEFNNLSRDLQNVMIGNDKSKFELANSIWISDTFKASVKKDFLDRDKKYYGAMVASLDFNKSSSADTINNWVKDNTKGKIEKAIDGTIDSATLMYLINTIYFKAEWSMPFDTNLTKEADFTTPNETKQVKMMRSIANSKYFENAMFQGILLPYNDNKTSMFILLPKGNLADFQTQITSDNLSNWLSEMGKANQRVNLSLPKVSLEYQASLIPSLSSMGMTDAFDGNADFTNMASNSQAQGLYIEAVAHKTYLAIDEKGTEAAAMTASQATNGPPPTLPDMIVNHPFLLGIVDDSSGAVLFLGSITDPQ